MLPTLPAMMSSITTPIANAAYFLYEVVTPMPTSPYFKKGGPFHGYNEDLCQIAAAIVAFAVIDWLLIRPLVVPKARYFALHVVCNAMVCVLGFEDVVRTFTENPLTVFRGPGYAACNSVIAALHLYHCLAFNLSADDIFHHVTFVVTLCSMALSGKQVAGASIGYACTFISGLPGGIDYLMLTLSAHGIVSKDFQKDLYTKINIWLRAPGLVVYVVIWWYTRINGPHPVPIYITIAACSLHFFNGQYYTQQAIESNAVYKYKQKLAGMGVKIPEVKFSDIH